MKSVTFEFDLLVILLEILIFLVLINMKLPKILIMINCGDKTSHSVLKERDIKETKYDY